MAEEEPKEDGGGGGESFKDKVINIEKAIETEVKKDVGIVAEATHMPPW